MENVNTNENVGQISLLKLWEVLKKYFCWILIAAVVVGCAAAVVAQFAIKDSYSSSIEYLLANLTEYNGTELNNMGTYIGDAISKLSNTNTLERVVENSGLGIEGASDDSSVRRAVSILKNSVKIVSNTQGSGFIITMSYQDAEITFRVIQAYKDLMPDLVDEYGLKAIDVNESPYSAPTAPSNRNRAIKYGLVGAVAGAVLLYAIFLVHDLFDVTIRTEADLKKYLNYPVIGMIPEYTGDGIPGDKGVKNYGYTKHGR